MCPVQEDKDVDTAVLLGESTADVSALAASEKVSREQEQLEKLFSLIRAGKYREVEEILLGPDLLIPIDYPDAAGNSMLLVAVQNGNKRIAKLCLRRGAGLNHQNLSGNGVLHFAFAYKHEELAQYLIEKGADDALRNADGLVCYECTEGLTLTDVDNI